MQVHNKRNATRARARRASDSLSMSVSQEGKEKGSGEKPLGVELPAGLGTPVFRATWAEWIGYRRQHGWSVKAPWAQRQLAMLAEHGPEVAAAALQQSMRQGWQGVFPEKVADARLRHSPEDSDLTPTDYSYLDS